MNNAPGDRHRVDCDEPSEVQRRDEVDAVVEADQNIGRIRHPCEDKIVGVVVGGARKAIDARLRLTKARDVVGPQGALDLAFE